MVTLIGPRVWSEISDAAAACRNPARVAVAYFGMHGDRLLPLSQGSSIVVDASIPALTAGSTCPTALSRLVQRGVDVYSFQSLHAKVYAFDEVAFVGSANASAHSDRRLIEAVVRIHSEAVIASIRQFVDALCVTKLSATDLVELREFYRPPRVVRAQPVQSKYATLIMELTNEQGGGRETQVQPPKAVWQTYFGIAPDRGRLPHLTLVKEGAQPIQREVVKHHHNYTVEISGAELPRPAILRMRRIARHRYWYQVHRPDDKAFADLQILLRNVCNPLWQGGRRWILV